MLFRSDEFKRYLATRDVHFQLQDKIRDLPQIDALSLIDRDGNVLNFSRSWPTPVINVADRDYFVAHRDNPDLGPFISAPVRNRGTGTWTIYLARRVSDANGDFAGQDSGRDGDPLFRRVLSHRLAGQ